MLATHNSLLAHYRSPFGAVQKGSTVVLSLELEGDDYTSEVYLRLWRDDVGEELILMHSDGIFAGKERFSASLHCDELGLIWYSFRIKSKSGDVWAYGASAEHRAGEGSFHFGEPPSWQITVYEKTRRVEPDWYRKGIVYQIFPDRFNRSKDAVERFTKILAEPRKGPARSLVSDWNETPFYKKDEDGNILEWSFFGGDLKGIEDKLDYLQDLGVNILYLNPIFEAASNHRYDTANYLKVDPLLGGDEAFAQLADAAHKRGMRIILDGVFNHVGADSLYFNRYQNYDSTGAFAQENGPYDNWFKQLEDGSWDAWWGVQDLPAVDESQATFRDLICGENGVVRTWLRAGADGWRLDVADELSDDFISEIKQAALAEKPDALILGEVWEDASNKVAYGQRRQYFMGHELDAVMNYPLRDGLLSYLTEQISAPDFAAELATLQENYPRSAFYSNLNLLGSHDRARLLNSLVPDPTTHDLSDEQKRSYTLEKNQESLALSRFWLASLIQLLLPGVPSIYYGDEAGLVGLEDPYNRKPFPWDSIHKDCFTMYRNVIALRKSSQLFVDGDFEALALNEDVFAFWRRLGDESALVLVNASTANSHQLSIDLPEELKASILAGSCSVQDIISGAEGQFNNNTQKLELFLWPNGSSVIYFNAGPVLAKKLQPGKGLLCHLTSIPKVNNSQNEALTSLIDSLAEGSYNYWQILPLNPTDAFGSPYAGLSAFAANTNLLTTQKCSYAELKQKPEFKVFLDEEKSWLEPYAVFRALKRKFKEARWQSWPKKYRTYTPEFLQDKELRPAIEEELAEQFLFMQSWQEIRARAKAKHIAIIGDMPLYVSADSCDAWLRPDLFKVDERGEPRYQAGAPADNFAEEGQLWGNPTYVWEAHKQEDFAWWMARLKRAFALYDFVRLDHFLGFASYFEIEQGKKATEGAWCYGPGLELFSRAYAEFGELPCIAEDLGSITPAVRMLLAQTQIMGMNVIQFADQDPLPAYKVSEHKICYSSTHDTATLKGFALERYPEEDSAFEQLKQRVAESGAGLCMYAAQDLLALDNESRMNVPGVAEGNWSWQMDASEFASLQRLLSQKEQ